VGNERKIETDSQPQNYLMVDFLFSNTTFTAVFSQ